MSHFTNHMQAFQHRWKRVSEPQEILCGIWWPPHPTGMCGTRPFFLVGVRAQRRGPHAPGISKNAYGPIGISFIRAPQAPGDEKTPPERGNRLLGKAPWGRRKSPGTETHSARSVPQITRPADRSATRHLESCGPIRDTLQKNWGVLVV